MNYCTTLISIIVLFCISSCTPSTEQKSNTISKQSEDLIMVTQYGDTIPAGIPFAREGKVVPVDEMVLPPLPIQAKPEIRSISAPAEEYDLVLKESFPFPKPDTIFLGKNGIKMPVKRKAKVTITKATFPKATMAAPFFKKGMEQGGFDFLTIQQGLASNIIHSIIKDDKGFIWISSKNGLTRYDGKTFRHYTQEHGLPTETINGLCLDSLGNIWMAANDYGGIIKFDGKHFTQYNVDEGISYVYSTAGYSTAGSMNIRFDQDGKIMFITNITNNGKVVKFDGTHFIEYGKEQGLDYRLWPQFLRLPDEQLYFWTVKQLVQLRDDYLLQFDIEKTIGRSIYQFSRGLNGELNGEIWTGVKDRICTLKGQQIHCYHSKIMDEDKAIRFGYNKKGQLMLHHRSDAISLLVDDKLKYSLENTQSDQSLQFFSGWQIIDGKFWNFHNSLQRKLTQNGIQRFDPNAFQLDPELELTCSMLQDSKGNLWFGTHGKGVKVMNDFSSTVYPAIYQTIVDYLNPSITSIKGIDIIRTIYEDSKGHIWMGSSNGVLKFDGTQFTYYNLQMDSDEKTGLINSIMEDDNGNLWFGTSRIGFVKFDGDQFTFYRNQKPGGQSGHNWKNSNHAKAMIKDHTGRIWIGLVGGGLIQYDPVASRKKGKDVFKYYTEEQGLCSNYVVSLFEDSKGTLWIGSDRNGLSRFDGATFTNYTRADGLSDNDVWSIVEDAQQNIWLAVDDCLDLLFFEDDEKTLASVTTYCDFSGQSGGEFFSNATMKDHENNLYWGLVGYTVKINSNAILPNAKAPDIYLDEIEINQQQINFSEALAAKQNDQTFLFGKDQQFDLTNADFTEVVPFFNYPTDLSLPHDLNSLSFRFSATNDPDLIDVKFSYILEGTDKEWSEPSLENRASYRNLGPGAYTFKVKAAGKNSIWSEPFVYSFSITPPWWKTPYAYLAYVLITAAAVYFLYRYNLKRSLEQAETKRVKELDNLKTRLYTNITHEFRTPLTVIMGMNEHIDGNQQEKKLIRRNSKNLLRLVNQLLDLSKLESGTMKMDQIQGDIVVYLQYLTESFHSMAEEKGIRLMFYSEEDSLIMDYDEVKIQHIIYNLLSNAIKFTPGGGKVILHLNRIEEAGQAFLKLKVKDTGVGIPANKIPHIFDRFYQVDGSHTRKGEGTGIGLALTRELILMMNGEIEVESIVDKSTEFIVTLPIENQAVIQDATKIDELYFEASEKELVPIRSNEDQLDLPVVAENSEMPEVLIIEDNKDVATYIESLLRKDYKVHLATNGQLGIDAAIELIPDIIISDVMMPEKDGFEVCETLKQDARTSHIPIILLTAKAAQSDKVEGLKYGADAFLSKPFDKTELFIRIEKLIEIRRQLQERYIGLVYSKEAVLKSENKIKAKASIEDQFITEVRSVIEEKYSDPDFGVNELSKAMYMSHTQVYRKIKALTGKTPSQFIRSVRLQKGFKLLQNSELNISEVAYDVGFADPNYFSRTFQREFGKSPSEVRK